MAQAMFAHPKFLRMGVPVQQGEELSIQKVEDSIWQIYLLTSVEYFTTLNKNRRSVST